MKNNKDIALEWWDNLTVEEANELERKYGYFGHDIGVTNDEIIGMWNDEGQPEPIDDEPHTIYTHPEENAPKLDNILGLLNKMIDIVDNKVIELNDPKEAAKDHARYGGPFSTHHQNYEYMFEQGVNWQKERSFTLEQMLEAITYGFQYHRDSMHDNQDVPNGNKLQWILGKYIDPLKHKEYIDQHSHLLKSK